MNRRTVIITIAVCQAALIGGADILFASRSTGPSPPGFMTAIAAQGYASALSSGVTPADAYPPGPAACEGLLNTTVQTLAEQDVTAGLTGAPSLSTAANGANCTGLSPGAVTAGTVADGTCVQWNGMEAELSTFASASQQADFVRSCLTGGVTIMEQGTGWVLS